MIGKKDLKVGLITDCGAEIVYIGEVNLCYKRGTGLYSRSIEYFCLNYSQKKEKGKLYAYMDNYNEVKFTDRRCDIWDKHTRAPQYDLEF